MEGRKKRKKNKPQNLKLIIPPQIPSTSPIRLQELLRTSMTDLFRILGGEADDCLGVVEHRVEDEEVAATVSGFFEADDSH